MAKATRKGKSTPSSSGRGKRSATKRGRGEKKKQQNALKKRKTSKKQSGGEEMGGRRGRDAVARPTRRQRQAPLRLEPITESVNSIHRDWKQKLGGLIRYYVNYRKDGEDADAAEREVELMYFSNGCSVTGTRDAILRAIAGDTRELGLGPDEHNWLDVSMVIETEGENSVKIEDVDGGYEPRQGNGLKLRLEKRPGEGPAFRGTSWNTVIVPPWAVGKSYFLEVVNRSPLDLSCEMTIDGHDKKAAKNAPIPKYSTRPIRPDNARYFETHQWLLEPAKRIKLHSFQSLQQRTQPQQQPNHRWAAQRYNDVKPDYKGNRVSYTDYPDPCTFGWKFTGRVEQSCVEFYEKHMLPFGVVLLDFYYTTGTVKTVLEHPTTGRNALFRKCYASPEKYKQILQNPRVHTGIGYRTRDQRPDQADAPMADAVPNAADVPDDGTIPASAADQVDEPMADAVPNAADVPDDGTIPASGASNGDNETVYYAKNEAYDFKEGGHANRELAMAKLQPTNDFKAWEEVTRKEWACIHAKFFVSSAVDRGRRFVGGDRSKEPEAGGLPAMAPVVDVKSAEKAVLATQFHATGPLGRPKRTSEVRMERICGLNDNPEWGSGPVFECKLYYRAEENNDSDGMEDEDVSDGTDDDEVPLAERLTKEVPLDSYKQDVLQQLDRVHRENVAADKDEAEAMIKSCRVRINAAEDSVLVDEVKNCYYSWWNQQQWADKGS